MGKKKEARRRRGEDWDRILIEQDLKERRLASSMAIVKVGVREVLEVIRRGSKLSIVVESVFITYYFISLDLCND